MRVLLIGICCLGLLTSSAWGQAMSEAAAAAAGSSVGAAGGRQVSKGISSIFNKINGTTAKAAKGGSQSTILKVGPGVPAAESVRSSGGVPEAPPLIATPAKPAAPSVRRTSRAVQTEEPYNVPPPPPLPGERVRRSRPAATSAAVAVPSQAPVVVTPPPPPPPVMTAENLQAVSAGMERNALLELGQPAARITMSKDGHLVEVFRYTNNGSPLGTVRLSDGAVANVEVR